MAEQLRVGMNEIIREEKVAGYVYGDVSIFHVYLEAFPGSGVTDQDQLLTRDVNILKGIPASVVTAFQKNLLDKGVDLVSYTGGVTSSAHSKEDIEFTLGAFGEVIKYLVKENIVAKLKMSHSGI